MSRGHVIRYFNCQFAMANFQFSMHLASSVIGQGPTAASLFALSLWVGRANNNVSSAANNPAACASTHAVFTRRMAMRIWFPLAALLWAGWFGGGVALAQPAKTARTVQDDAAMFSA